MTLWGSIPWDEVQARAARSQVPVAPTLKLAQWGIARPEAALLVREGADPTWVRLIAALTEGPAFARTRALLGLLAWLQRYCEAQGLVGLYSHLGTVPWTRPVRRMAAQLGWVQGPSGWWFVRFSPPETA